MVSWGLGFWWGGGFLVRGFGKNGVRRIVKVFWVSGYMGMMVRMVMRFMVMMVMGVLLVRMVIGDMVGR